VLAVWCKRYKVTLDYTLRTLLKYWDQKIVRVRGGKRVGTVIGVRIATLVGSVSQSVLETAILEEFPTLENEAAWRSNAQMRMLPPDGLEAESAEDAQTFIADYAERVRRKRHLLLTRKQPGTQYTRRPYRNNPWR